jgi:hypothetical protein
MTIRPRGDSSIAAAIRNDTTIFPKTNIALKPAFKLK